MAQLARRMAGARLIVIVDWWLHVEPAESSDRNSRVGFRGFYRFGQPKLSMMVRLNRRTAFVSWIVPGVPNKWRR